MPGTREKVEGRARVARRRKARRTAKDHRTGQRDSFDYSALDLGIVPMVRLLRRHGFKTTGSCQGGEGHGYPFPTVIIAYERPKKELRRLRRVMQEEGIACTVSIHYALQPTRLMGDSSYLQVQIWESRIPRIGP